MKKNMQCGVIELSRILAGKSHAPVVYFARMGENVKIGTTTNLKGRMSSLYVPMEDVLAIVPGGEDVEDAYHDRFRSSQVTGDGRKELFRLDAGLRFFLGLWRDNRGTPRRHSRWRGRREWRADLERRQEHADRCETIRDLLVDALRGYGIDALSRIRKAA